MDVEDVHKSRATLHFSPALSLLCAGTSILCAGSSNCTTRATDGLASLLTAIVSSASELQSIQILDDVRFENTLVATPTCEIIRS